MPETPKIAPQLPTPTIPPQISQPLQKVAQALPQIPPVSKLTHPSKLKFIIFPLAIILGIGTGYLLNSYFSAKSSITAVTNIDSSKIKVGDVVGADNDKAFPDNAEGVLEKGGLDGEGSHKLLRSGGASQTAYLTSSIVDLDAFVGHRVRVWGETFAAQKAGWLMDVGRVEVLELNAAKPE